MTLLLPVPLCVSEWPPKQGEQLRILAGKSVWVASCFTRQNIIEIHRIVDETVQDLRSDSGHSVLCEYDSVMLTLSQRSQYFLGPTIFNPTFNITFFKNQNVSYHYQ